MGRHAYVIYYAVCTIALIAIIVPFYLFVAHPIGDWLGPMLPNWILLVLPAVWIGWILIERRKAKRGEAQARFDDLVE